MGLEIKSAKRLENPATPSPDRQWIANLHVAYGRIQQVVSEQFAQAIPGIVLSSPPPIIVVSDESFTRYIQQAAGAAPVIDETVAAKKKREIGSTQAGVGASGAYIVEDGSIILPQHIASNFQRGGVLRVAATMVLLEEYLHHVTTKVSPDKVVESMGFVKFPERPSLIENNFEQGAIYQGELDEIVEKPGVIPEAGGDPNVILTENATSLLVYLLALKLNEPIFTNHRWLHFTAVRANRRVEGVTINPTSTVLKQVILAIMAGKPSLLGMDVPSVAKGDPPRINIKTWLEESDLRIMISDPRRSTQDERIDIFSYEDSRLEQGEKN